MPFIPIFFSQNLVFLQVEAFAEAFHTTSRVQNALLTSEEWMTLRADVNLQNGLNAQRLKAIATGATDRGFDVIWVNAFFHLCSRRLDPLRSMAEETPLSFQ